MNIAVLLLNVNNKPRTTTFTAGWVLKVMNEVAVYFVDQSGRRAQLTCEVFDWLQLDITSETWEEYGFGAGNEVLPVATKRLHVDFDRFDAVFLVIDKDDSRSAVRAGRFTHFGAQDFTPAIIAHELGHLYGAGHANLDSIQGPLVYGDSFCTMGGESNKYTYDSLGIGGPGSKAGAISSGPGMVVPTLMACRWLTLEGNAAAEYLSPALRANGEAVIELAALRGAPPIGWKGPPVVAWGDGRERTERFTIEYRLAEGWDRGLPDPGGEGRGWVVIHIATGTGWNTTTLQVGALPATLGSTGYIPRVGFRVSVAALPAPPVGAPRDQRVTLRVDKDRLFIAWKGVAADQRIFGNSTADGGNFTPQRELVGSGAGTSNAPSLAALGHRLFMAWKGEGSDPRIFYTLSAEGTEFLEQRLMPGTGGTSDAPSLAATASRLYVAWKGAGSDERLFFNYSDDGTTFSPQAVIPGSGGSSEGPAIATSSTRVYVAWKGAGADERLFFNSSTDGVTFTEQQVVPNAGGSSHGPALATFRDRLYVAWKGAGEDARLFFTSTGDAVNFEPQQVIPGSGGSSDRPSLGVFNNRLFVAWKGAAEDGRLFINSSADGKTFTSQQVVPGSGGSSSRPVLALLPDP